MIVLDTHAWVWWAAGSSKLSAASRKRIAGSEKIGVSAISAWEVSMLVEKGRLRFDRDVLNWIEAALALPLVEYLPLSPAVAVASTRLDPKFHGDPADRIIVATAMLSQATLVTRDRRIRRSGIVECVLA